ncbi:hypothetical protein TNCV_1053811 [Trichonephila clavipes]|nr:hypothetical protein TNCV_1053811 [Trichonephila clavipes]
MCKAVIHYGKRKLLSDIDVSKKAGNVSKTTNALDVRRLPAPLNTLKRFLRRYAARHHLIHGPVPVRGPGVADHWFNRPGRRAAGVAIYHKQKNSHIVTPHMNITYRQTSGLGIVSNDIGGHMCGRMLIRKRTNSDFGGRIHFLKSNGTKN